MPLCGLTRYVDPLNSSVDGFKGTLLQKSSLVLVLALPHLVLSALKHSGNRDSMVVWPQTGEGEFGGNSRQLSVCKPVEPLCGWVTGPLLGLISSPLKQGHGIDPSRIVGSANLSAVWGRVVGIQKALNSAVSLSSALTLIPAKSVQAGTIFPSLLFPHRCLSTVFLDQSQTKGRRNRKERKKQVSGNTRGTDQNYTSELEKWAAEQVRFRVEQGEAKREEGVQFEDLRFRPGPDMSWSFTPGSSGLGALNFPLCKIGHDPCHGCPLVGRPHKLTCSLSCKPFTEGFRGLGGVPTDPRQALAEASW